MPRPDNYPTESLVGKNTHCDEAKARTQEELPEVVVAMNCLDSANNRLHSGVMNLQDALHRVLSVAGPEQAENCVGPQRFQAQLANEIDTQERCVNNMAEVVEDLLRRLEV